MAWEIGAKHIDMWEMVYALLCCITLLYTRLTASLGACGGGSLRENIKLIGKGIDSEQSIADDDRLCMVDFVDAREVQSIASWSSGIQEASQERPPDTYVSDNDNFNPGGDENTDDTKYRQDFVYGHLPRRYGVPVGVRAAHELEAWAIASSPLQAKSYDILMSIIRCVEDIIDIVYDMGFGCQDMLMLYTTAICLHELRVKCFPDTESILHERSNALTSTKTRLTKNSWTSTNNEQSRGWILSEEPARTPGLAFRACVNCFWDINVGSYISRKETKDFDRDLDTCPLQNLQEDYQLRADRANDVGLSEKLSTRALTKSAGHKNTWTYIPGIGLST